MRLVMFHPLDRPMERGWVGRIEGDRVIHLAAQTLEAFFTGGGKAREHAVYPLAAVRVLAPVLHPPAVRVFEDERSFAFANPAAIVGPEAIIAADGRPLAVLPRLAAVIGADGAIGGFTSFAEWRRPDAGIPKDRDFAFGLGPVVVTADAVEGRPDAVVRVGGAERLRGQFEDFEWSAARDVAAAGTALRPGDLLAGPELGSVVGLAPGDDVQIEVDELGAQLHTLSR